MTDLINRRDPKTDMRDIRRRDPKMTRAKLDTFGEFVSGAAIEPSVGTVWKRVRRVLESDVVIKGTKK
jgi:hypothetical protein